MEFDFEQRKLPDGRVTIDAFIIVCDISRRVDPQQFEILSNLLVGASKTKKPVILAATKCDVRNYSECLKDLQQLLHRKELRNAVYSIVSFIFLNLLCCRLLSIFI